MDGGGGKAMVFEVYLGTYIRSVCVCVCMCVCVCVCGYEGEGRVGK